MIKTGQLVRQETRLFDEVKNTTRPMRSKEEASDYRYFPDPDLPVLIIKPEDAEAIKTQMPVLPWGKQQTYMTHYQLSAYDAKILSHDRDLGLILRQLLVSAQPSQNKSQIG